MSLEKLAARKLTLSFVIILILSYAVAAQDWNWKPFNPKNQPWTILAPGTMQADEEARTPGSSKGSYAYNDFNGFFAVIYRDSPKRILPFPKPNYSSYIERVRDDVVKANRGELIKDTDFTFRKFKGREAQVKFATGTTRSIEGQTVTKYRVQRFRMFFVGKRFYIVLAVASENEINSPAIDRYLDSFAVNSAPRVIANSYSLDEDTSLTVNVKDGILANDEDDEDNPLTVASSAAVTPPSHGSLTINADGSFSYKPEPNYSGTDSFTYKANDGLIDSQIATVTITVKPVNDAPVLSNVPASQTVDELTQVSFTATATDIDNPPSSLKFSLSGAPAGATIDPSTGILNWTPTEAQGPGNFTFQVNLTDGLALVSATTSITVREVNAPPQLVSVPNQATINELEAYTFAVKATDPDIPVQSLTYSLIDAPAGAAINSSTGIITWNPTEAQGNGSTYKFTIRVSDGVVNADSVATITVKEVNSAPTLSSVADQTIDELKSLSVNVTGTDADIPANTLSYSLEPGAPAGMSIDSQTGAISWTPAENQGAGDYSVTVRLTDNGTPSLSDTKTFKVHVNEVNVAPVLNSIGNKTVNEETPLSIKLAATDTDLPANSLSYSMINTLAGATLDSTTGTFNWTPTEAQGAGNYTITFRVTDNGTPALSDEETITITVNEVNKPPVAENSNANTDEDSAISLTLRGADPDLPANTLRYSVVNPPAHGKLSGSAPNLTYTPNPDFNGSDSFTFTVNDSTVNSAAATFNITIKPVNDLPVAANDTATTTEDVAVTINVLANDKDVDGDRLTVTNVSNAVNGKVEITNNQLTFTPNAQFSGVGSFNYTVSDGNGGTATGSVSLTVTPKPKQP